MEDNVCAWCQGPLPPQIGMRDRVTCSPRCRTAMHRARQRRMRPVTPKVLREVRCAVCGGTFQTVSPLRRFCSKACSQRAYRCRQRETLQAK